MHFSQVYWLGDLNYRINKLTHEEVKRLLHFNDVKNILKYDQLGLEQSSGRVFEVSLSKYVWVKYNEI